MNDNDEHDDDALNNVTASPDDVAYECGYHDGADYGYRLARSELTTCPECGANLTRDEPS